MKFNESIVIFSTGFCVLSWPFKCLVIRGLFEHHPLRCHRNHWRLASGIVPKSCIWRSRLQEPVPQWYWDDFSKFLPICQSTMTILQGVYLVSFVGFTLKHYNMLLPIGPLFMGILNKVVFRRAMSSFKSSGLMAFNVWTWSVALQKSDMSNWQEVIWP